MAALTSLKEYLKRYESNNEEEKKRKNKKKKKKRVQSEVAGVFVVDEDPVWQKPVKVDEEEDNDSDDEEKPLIDEDIEVKRMKRLEQLRARRPYNAIAEDGSGWVSLSPKQAISVDPSSEMSPPRRQRTRKDTPSPSPEGKHSDSGREETDLSPPRKQPRRHHTQKDMPSPEPEGKRLDSGREETDLSPPRKQQRRHHTQKDTPSPEPEKKRSDSGREETDLSPPWKQKGQYHTLSPEPVRKPAYVTGKDYDMSPPQRSRARMSEDYDRRKSEVLDSSDISPPRRVRCSPPQQDHEHTSPGSDLSPPRKTRKDFGRLEAPDPRLHRRSHESGGSRTSLVQDASQRKNQKKLADPAPSKERPKTGLITGHDIREEISKTKEEDALRFEQMDPSMSGKGAEPVYRDKKGERISKEEYLKLKQKVKEKPKEKKVEWGKGLAQKHEAEARLQELELEKDKPFARSRDDPELDKMLKERVRWGDPMAHLVKKKHSEPVLPDFGDSEKMKESGFIIPQEIPSHSWIIRGLDAAPNRYGIRPGRHWDGVDRSNGFEKQLFTRLNEKQATEMEAYLWSVSDM